MRKAVFRQLTSQPSEAVWPEEVEDDYYAQHPRKDEILNEDVMRQELGRDIARRHTRRHVHGETFHFEQLGVGLLVGGPLEELKPVPSSYLDRSLQSCLFTALDLPAGKVRLRKLIRWLVLAHLRWLRAKDTKRLRRFTRRCVQRLAGKDEQARVLYRRIHRAARYRERIVSALRGIFFADLDFCSVSRAQEFLRKLEKDSFADDAHRVTSFVVDICEHRRKCYANQSGWRLDKAMSHYYTWQIARSRLDGTSEKDTFAEIEKAAGLPIPATDTQRLARYKAYQERRRSKLGLLPQ